MAEALDMKVEELNLKGRSTAIRQTLNLYNKSDQPKIKKRLVEELQNWRKQFHNVGVNINQVAYKMNAGHPLSTDQIIEVQLSLQREFKELVRLFWRIEEELQSPPP
jgi:hypothetical protein